MNKTIDERDMVAANMAITKRFGGEFAVTRKHDLSLIVKQVSQLSKQEPEQRVAHVVYMVSKLKPFKDQNQKTALVVGAIFSKRLGVQFDLKSVSGMIKHDVPAKNIAESMYI